MSLRPCIATIIFDMDDVLCDYDVQQRLNTLSAMTGLSPAVIHEAIWASGFEDETDAGAFCDGSDYLAAFNNRLGVALTPEQWVAARRSSMTPWHDMLALVQNLGRHYRLALLTNNGPLLRDTIDLVFPQLRALFGKHLFFTGEMGAAKPDRMAFIEAARRCRVAVDACLFIDDRPDNVEGARAAGMNGVCFTGIMPLRQTLGALGIAA